jgi:PAS domain S-box-containing protein
VFTSVNRAMEALIGWSREERIGQSTDAIATPVSREQWVDRTRRKEIADRHRNAPSHPTSGSRCQLTTISLIWICGAMSV